jgi:hypothetical protein
MRQRSTTPAIEALQCDFPAASRQSIETKLKTRKDIVSYECEERIIANIFLPSILAAPIR